MIENSTFISRHSWCPAWVTMDQLFDSSNTQFSHLLHLKMLLTPRVIINVKCDDACVLVSH